MKILIPKVSILNPNRKYSKWADVQKTWKAFGWKPMTPAERKKKAKFKNISVGELLKA